MNKKAVLVLVICIVCRFDCVVSGKLYWNKKIANATGQTSEVTKAKSEVKDSGAKKAEKKQDAKSSLMNHMRRIYQMK